MNPNNRFGREENLSDHVLLNLRPEVQGINNPYVYLEGHELGNAVYRKTTVRPAIESKELDADLEYIPGYKLPSALNRDGYYLSGFIEGNQVIALLSFINIIQGVQQQLMKFQAVIAPSVTLKLQLYSGKIRQGNVACTTSKDDTEERPDDRMLDTVATIAVHWNCQCLSQCQATVSFEYTEQHQVLRDRTIHIKEKYNLDFDKLVKEMSQLVC